MGKGTWNGSKSQLAMLHSQNAVFRDTATVLPDAEKPFVGQSKQGGCGWTVIRFIADNPGVWPFHCHVTWHFVMGMQTIFIVSMDDIPDPPSDVMICGDVNPHKLVTKSENNGKRNENKMYLILLATGWGLFVLASILCTYLIVNNKRNNRETYSVLLRTTKDPANTA